MKISIHLIFVLFTLSVKSQNIENYIVISDMDNTYKKTHGFCLLIDTWNVFITKRTYKDMPMLYKDLQTQGAEIFILTNQTKLTRKHMQKQFRKDGLKPDTLICRKKFTKGFEHKTKSIEHIIAQYPDKKLILIGDNLGKDSQIYAGIKNKYPNTVGGIYIRPIKKNKIIEPGQTIYKNAEQIDVYKLK